MISARLYTKDEIKSVQTTDDNAIGNGGKNSKYFFMFICILEGQTILDLNGD